MSVRSLIGHIELYEAAKALEKSGLLQTLLEMDAAAAEEGEDPIAAPHVERLLAAIKSVEANNA